jgi:hypothetical protein
MANIGGRRGNMNSCAFWSVIAVLWLVVSIACFIGIWMKPQVRIKYAVEINLTQRIVFVLFGIGTTYVWTHSLVTMYIWLASLPFLIATSYIAHRQRKLVMSPR